MSHKENLLGKKMKTETETTIDQLHTGNDSSFGHHNVDNMQAPEHPQTDQ